ncbi:PTS system mannose/fructose/sorbose family transporter subunit IID [Pelosinus sp. UFO1]|uniref:PTS system mannose/fructose/sorbose family transporter subunit IID n=1 Tax=Pelosinus sp. UFO1 TaxID=484770 RepID=UPI0004D0DEFB|nr:PTS mannose transporter subunit IID [Pelosinus sp. UFO1]AIF50634.1 PTS system, mannose/fructose/sorbose family, IID subunit [Pelosinus sp. UFO1]
MVSDKKLTKGDLFWVFLRSNLIQGSWNYERMQALGYCFSLVPVINRLYEKKEDRISALKRHLEFFNTHPFVISPILGVNLALEEEKANGAEIEDSTIHAVKVGLMGPLAGIGDPIFWGTLRPVTAALGAGLAMQGNVLGPLLFFLLFNTVRLLIRWYGLLYAYRAGLGIMQDIAGDKLRKLTEGASILGLFVMGALVAKWTSINVSLVVAKSGEMITTVQDILNQLMPNMLSLGLTFLCIYLLRKGVSPLTIIAGLFFIGIAGYWAGILS